MNPKQYLASPQFQWSAWQSLLAYLAVVLAAGAAYISGQSDGRATVAGLILAAIPIVNRLREGVADAVRDESGAVLPADVTPNPPVTVGN
jgi:hypothetical protein